MKYWWKVSSRSRSSHFILFNYAWKSRQQEYIYYDGKPLVTTADLSGLPHIFFQPLVLPGLQLPSWRCDLTEPCRMPLFLLEFLFLGYGSSGCPAGLSNQLNTPIISCTGSCCLPASASSLTLALTPCITVLHRRGALKSLSYTLFFEPRQRQFTAYLFF